MFRNEARSDRTQDDNPGPDSSKKTHFVLFVDDEDGILKAVKRVLRSEAYSVLLARSGEEALCAISAQPVQVVVSDLHMPEMDGVTFLSTVKKKAPDAIRLAFSGRSDSEAIVDAINSGNVHRYIVKPWDDDQLKITIRQAIELWELQSERKHLLETLTEQNQRLEALVEQRTRQILAVQRQADIGRYASQIVHNLRNPLHTISAAIDLLVTVSKRQNLTEENLEKWLGVARSAINDLKAIMEGILAYAREQVSCVMEPLDVNGFIKNEMIFFEMMPQFKYEIDKELLLDRSNPKIKANPLHIKQILDNLVNNALDAMEAVKKKRLSIATSVVGDHLEIRVSDTGEGIAPEHIPRIFASDFTTKPVDKGNGLGLASVKAMLDTYHGTIAVESTVGVGTTFKVCLPGITSSNELPQLNHHDVKGSCL